jgi:hypothetical protein
VVASIDAVVAAADDDDAMLDHVLHLRQQDLSL